MRGRVGVYVFISSISTYTDTKTANFDESYPLAIMSDDDAAKITKNVDVAADTYSAQKVLCEREITRVFADKALLVRAGLLIGPHDLTDRFLYWVRRVEQGGGMLVPDTLDQRWQLIDARDLVTWTLTMIEREHGGAFNVTGERIVLGDILNACKRASDSDTQFVRVSEQFIAVENIGEWQSLPLWVPSDSVDYAGLWACNVDKARASGLTLQPIWDTICDTLAWDTKRDGDLKVGLRRDRERELIETWKKQIQQQR